MSVKPTKLPMPKRTKISLALGAASLFAWLLPVPGLVIGFTGLLFGWSPERTSPSSARSLAIIASVAGVFLSVINGSIGAYLGASRQLSGSISNDKPAANIAFISGDGIGIMNADGTNRRPLASGFMVNTINALAWSPDGKQLAFDGSRSAVAYPQIWVINADGSHLKCLTGSPAKAERYPSFLLSHQNPSWLPKNGGLTYTVDDLSSENSSQLLTDANGTKRYRLPSISGFELPTNSTLEWSKSGRLVYSKEVGEKPRDAVEGYSDLFVATRLGATPKNITSTPGTSEYFPKWSPNENRILFIAEQRNGDQEPRYSIEIMNADGSGRHTVLFVHSNGRADWLPDGSGIVFVDVNSENSAVWTANSDGTNVHKVTDGEAWSPTAQPVTSITTKKPSSISASLSSAALYGCSGAFLEKIRRYSAKIILSSTNHASRKTANNNQNTSDQSRSKQKQRSLPRLSALDNYVQRYYKALRNKEFKMAYEMQSAGDKAAMNMATYTANQKAYSIHGIKITSSEIVNDEGRVVAEIDCGYFSFTDIWNFTKIGDKWAVERHGPNQTE